MRKFLSCAIGPLCLLLLPNTCSAQFQNHFSLYTTQAITDVVNGVVTVQQTVTLDGYTQVPGSMPPSAVHTPRIENTIGSTGGWYNGPSTCPTCYISFSHSVSAQQSDAPGNLIGYNSAAQVSCNFAGVFFNLPPVIWMVKIGVTNLLLDHTDTTNCYYKMSCPSNTTPTCPLPVLTLINGMLTNPPCIETPYDWEFFLVVNGQCLSIGFGTTHITAHSCQ